MEIKDLPVYYKAVGPADVYRRSILPTLPQGYVATGFRQPEVGDSFIGTDGRVNIGNNGGNPNRDPRIIIEKLKRKVFTFTATGEHRHLQQGEWYINTVSSYPQFSRYNGSGLPNWPLDVYKLTETEI